MTDLSIFHYSAAALVATAWLGILVFAALKGWNGWLALKRTELELIASQRGGSAMSAGDALGVASAATRIDVADLKERIRKLEAIAAGIDM